MANNVFQVKRTSTSGRTPNTTGSYATNTQYISAGELALNMADGILYSSNGSAAITVGSNLVNQRITNSFIIDNNKAFRFTTVNTSAVAYMIQQSDDNFVMYSTNTSYGSRAVFSIFANSDNSEFSFSVPVRFNSNVTALTANGTTGSAGQILATNGSAVYWVSPGAASVNTAAQFTWTNLHTFQANVSFTGNGIGITSNTGAIYLGGLADANWRIGRNTGASTKWRYTNNSIDIITANSNLEGMTIGLINGNSYFETGYLGTYIASNLTIGNTASNSTINSTAFSGTANNATNLGGVAAASYVNTSGAYTITGILTYTANLVVNAAIIAGGNSGTAGQVLTSNGAGNVYWSNVSSNPGLGTGAGTDTAFFINGQTVNTNYTTTATQNYLSAGPITVNSGITVTITTGSRWAIV